MHEGSIVAELIRVAEQHAPPAARILRLGVQVGRLTGISPDAMQFYFEVMREGTRCEGARLEVALLPLRGRCGACQQTVTLESEAVWTCAACGQTAVGWENGDELDLRELEVEDA